MSTEESSDHLYFVLNVVLYSFGNKFEMSLLREGWVEQRWAIYINIHSQKGFWERHF